MKAQPIAANSWVPIEVLGGRTALHLRTSLTSYDVVEGI